MLMSGVWRAGSGLAEGLQDAPRGVTQGVESLAGTMSEAGTGLMDKFRGFMSFQQVPPEPSCAGTPAAALAMFRLAEDKGTAIPA